MMNHQDFRKKTMNGKLNILIVLLILILPITTLPCFVGQAIAFESSKNCILETQALGKGFSENYLSGWQWISDANYFCSFADLYQEEMIEADELQNERGYIFDFQGGVEYLYSQSFKLGFLIFGGRAYWQQERSVITKESLTVSASDYSEYLGGVLSLIWTF